MSACFTALLNTPQTQQSIDSSNLSDQTPPFIQLDTNITVYKKCICLS